MYDVVCAVTVFTSQKLCHYYEIIFHLLENHYENNIIFPYYFEVLKMCCYIHDLVISLPFWKCLYYISILTSGKIHYRIINLL